MSSGSNATGKSSVASTISLSKASSSGSGSSLHRQASVAAAGNGQVEAAAAPRAVKRQKVAADPATVPPKREVSAEIDNNNCLGASSVEESEKESSGEETGGGTAAGPAGRSKKKFVGVRQRPSGRWVAEIKDTTQKIRLWLGTFDSAEDAARAYDEAAWLLRGANTRTNFVPAVAAAAAATCEGGAVPAAASKAARLIRLRQSAAAAASSKSGDHGHGPLFAKKLSVQTSESLMHRPDIQQSITLGHQVSSTGAIAPNTHLTTTSTTTPQVVPSSPPVVVAPAAAATTARLICEFLPTVAAANSVHEAPGALFAANCVQTPAAADAATGGTVLEVDTASFDNPSSAPTPIKLESQQSITSASESTNFTVDHSRVPTSPQAEDSFSQTLHTSTGGARVVCSIRQNATAATVSTGGELGVQFAGNSVEDDLELKVGETCADHDRTSSSQQCQRSVRSHRRSVSSEDLSAFTVDSFVTSSELVNPCHPLTILKSRQSFTAEMIGDDSVAQDTEGAADPHYHHYFPACDTNRDPVSLFAAPDCKDSPSHEDLSGSLGACHENEALHQESSFTSSGQKTFSRDSLGRGLYHDYEYCGTQSAGGCGEIQVSALSTGEEVDQYTSPDMYRTELDRYSAWGAIRREREYYCPDLLAAGSHPRLSWPSEPNLFMDADATIDMDSAGLFGVVDLSCEHSGSVYTSSFDFSAELGSGPADVRDSCGDIHHLRPVGDADGLMLDDTQHLLMRMSNMSKYYDHRSVHDSAPGQHQHQLAAGFQECVLLTAPTSELDYCLSPPSPPSPLPGPPPALSPPPLSSTSLQLWRVQAAAAGGGTGCSAAWGGGPATPAAVDSQPAAASASDGRSGSTEGSGSPSLQEQALWSSMDLAPLCTVA